MRKQQAVRPAGLAIAAFLASVSPAVLAQIAAPVVPEVSAPVEVTPPVIMNGTQTPVAPDASTPATPVFAPNQPVVQATPSVEERRAAAVAAAEAESAARAESARPAAVTPRAAAPRAAPVEVAERQEAPAAPAPAPAPVAASPAANMNAAPVAATPMPATAPPPVVATPANDANTSLLWALGGGALLFLGIGASAMMRRRRGERDVLYTQDTREEVIATPSPAAAPAMAPAVRAAPYEPALRTPTAPSPTQPSASYASLEAMVAAPPSQENPFRTKAKRMRRARYLLAQREAHARNPEQTRAAPPPQTIAAEDRSQTVYSFGKQGQRSGSFKPRNI